MDARGFMGVSLRRIFDNVLDDAEGNGMTASARYREFQMRPA